MIRRMKKVSKTIGLAPGTLVHIGDKLTDKVKITVIDYDQNNINEKTVITPEECFTYKETETVSWINIDGVHDVETIRKIGEHFTLHPLVLEDIVNTNQRPKFEDFGDYIYIVLKMIYVNKASDSIEAEQVSLILGPNYVISFQEKEGDVFNAIRDRIRASKGRIRKMGADYLVHALLDAVVDNYFLILEGISEKIEGIEDSLIANPSPDNLRTIQGLKKDMIFLRKSVWPLREVISLLQRGESGLIKESTSMYLRDLYDHTIQVIDTVETLRDMTSGMLDIYMSSISNRMNEVMKVLTIIATIFIPITFIAGIYGMNFNTERSPFNMPELNWPFGYLFAWGVMIAIVLTMLAYFKRKKWF